MGILSRLRDLVLVRLHRLFNRMEDPAGLVALAIRDMEGALAELRVQAARIIADLKDHRRAIARLEAEQQDWTEKAELALSKGREDLALAALQEKQRAAASAQHIAQEEMLLADQLRMLEADLQHVDEKLGQARSQQKIIMSRLELAETRKRARLIGKSGTTAASETHLAMLERRADLAEGHADALGLTAPNLAGEIENLAPDEAARRELAALKAKRGNS